MDLEVFGEIWRETEVNAVEERGIENLVPNLEEEIVDEDMTDLFSFHKMRPGMPCRKLC